MRKLLIGVTLLALAGCSARAVLVQKKVDYDPKTEARMRIYQANGNGTTNIYNDTTCADAEEGTKGPSRNPFSKDNMHNGLPKRTLKNISIGMPFTQQAVQALARDSYMDTNSFIEKVVTANKPALIRGTTYLATSTLTMTCKVQAEFMPKPGVDYELHYGLSDNKCVIYVNELEPTVSVENTEVKAKVGQRALIRQCNKN